MLSDASAYNVQFIGPRPVLIDLLSLRHGDMRDFGTATRRLYDAYIHNAAYAAAVKHEGQPTVIIARTVKGYGLGETAQARNVAHQVIYMRDGKVHESGTADILRRPSTPELAQFISADE